MADDEALGDEVAVQAAVRKRQVVLPYPSSADDVPESPLPGIAFVAPKTAEPPTGATVVACRVWNNAFALLVIGAVCGVDTREVISTLLGAEETIQRRLQGARTYLQRLANRRAADYAFVRESVSAGKKLALFLEPVQAHLPNSAVGPSHAAISVGGSIDVSTVSSRGVALISTPRFCPAPGALVTPKAAHPLFTLPVEIWDCEYQLTLSRVPDDAVYGRDALVLLVTNVFSARTASGTPTTGNALRNLVGSQLSLENSSGLDEIVADALAALANKRAGLASEYAENELEDIRGATHSPLVPATLDLKVAAVAARLRRYSWTGLFAAVFFAMLVTTGVLLACIQAELGRRTIVCAFRPAEWFWGPLAPFGRMLPDVEFYRVFLTLTVESAARVVTFSDAAVATVAGFAAGTCARYFVGHGRFRVVDRFLMAFLCSLLICLSTAGAAALYRSDLLARILWVLADAPVLGALWWFSTVRTNGNVTVPVLAIVVLSVAVLMAPVAMAGNTVSHAAHPGESICLAESYPLFDPDPETTYYLDGTRVALSTFLEAIGYEEHPAVLAFYRVGCAISGILSSTYSNCVHNWVVAALTRSYIRRTPACARFLAFVRGWVTPNIFAVTVAAFAQPFIDEDEMRVTLTKGPLYYSHIASTHGDVIVPSTNFGSLVKREVAVAKSHPHDELDPYRVAVRSRPRLILTMRKTLIASSVVGLVPLLNALQGYMEEWRGFWGGLPFRLVPAFGYTNAQLSQLIMGHVESTEVGVVAFIGGDDALLVIRTRTGRVRYINADGANFDGNVDHDVELALWGAMERVAQHVSVEAYAAVRNWFELKRRGHNCTFYTREHKYEIRNPKTRRASGEFGTSKFNTLIQFFLWIYASQYYYDLESPGLADDLSRAYREAGLDPEISEVDFEHAEFYSLIPYPCSDGEWRFGPILSRALLKLTVSADRPRASAAQSLYERRVALGYYASFVPVLGDLALAGRGLVPEAGWREAYDGSEVFFVPTDEAYHTIARRYNVSPGELRDLATELLLHIGDPTAVIDSRHQVVARMAAVDGFAGNREVSEARGMG